MKKIIPGILILAISLSMFAVPAGINLRKNLAEAEECILPNGTTADVTYDECASQNGKLPLGKCTYTYTDAGGVKETRVNPRITKLICTTNGPGGFNYVALGYNYVSWEKAGNQNAAPPAGPAVDALRAAENQQKGSTLADQLDTCGVILWGSLVGCLQWLVYIVFVTVPSFLMKMSAKVFDFMAQLTLSPDIYSKEFIEKIWRVVRDFANIFFILILLYAAFQIMLDLGHGGGKKIIAAVILIALLVNFSLFFTKVVIDASNIVALIFYNRIDTKDVPAEQIGSEKPLAAALVSRFNINTFFDGSIIAKIKKENEDAAVEYARSVCPNNVCEYNTIQQIKQMAEGPSPFYLIAIMIAYGLVVFGLIYAFLVVGLSFLGRLITLIMLMIISPFAFVTFAVPKFKGINTIGFDSWIKQLFTVSFVAAIFMFILYIISEILSAKIFDSAVTDDTGATAAMILIFVPAILMVMLLLKGAKYAKSASGELTGTIISTAKVAGGIALGGAMGLTAAGLQATAGHAGKKIFESKGLKKWETEGNWLQRQAGRTLRTIGGGVEGKGGMAGSGFDLRKGVAGGALRAISGVTGLKLGAESKFLLKESGGYEADLKRRNEKRKKRAEGLKVSEGEPKKQHLNQMEDEHQALLMDNSDELEKIERKIKPAEDKRYRLREHLRTVDKDKDPEAYKKAQEEAEKASEDVLKLYDQRSRIKHGLVFDETTGKYNTDNGLISQKAVDLANEGAVTAAQGAESSAKAAEAAKEAAAKARTAVEEAKVAATGAAATRAQEQTASLREPTNIPLAEAVKAALENERKANEALAKAVENSTKTDAAVTSTAAAKVTAETRKRVADGFAATANEAASHGTGNSINNYEDEIIPEAKHAVEMVGKRRQQAYATNLENNWLSFWNRAEREKSAHEIRMGAKPEKRADKERDRGGGLVREALTEAVAEKFVGGRGGEKK